MRRLIEEPMLGRPCAQRLRGVRRFALATLAAAGLLSVAAASASALNLTGTWHAVYRCEAGWCVGENFPAEDTLMQEEGSNVVTGSNGTEGLKNCFMASTSLFSWPGYFQGVP